MIRAAAIAAIIWLTMAGSTFAAYIVPGTANPYLAGMPVGTGAGDTDLAPAHSPVLIDGIQLEAGMRLGFSATGLVSHGPSYDPVGPDGRLVAGQPWYQMALNAPENGLGFIHAPLNALVGIFLTDTLPSPTSPPGGLDFTAGGNVVGALDYLTLAPELNQVFLIGDGFTSDGIQQEIIVPEGATRLFLGIMDGREWMNNWGEFEVDVAVLTDSLATPEPSTLLLLVVGGVLAFLFTRRRTQLHSQR